MTDFNYKLFDSYLKQPDCIIWGGHITKFGYGVFYLESGKAQFVHRIMYERYNGPIPDNLEIDHICRNRICVNPNHLRAVTREENLKNRVTNTWKTSPYLNDPNILLMLQREHCQKGHKIKYLKVKDGQRLQCLDCIKDKDKDEQLYIKKSLESTGSHDNIENIIKPLETQFSKSKVKTTVKQLLRDIGIDTYSKNTIQCRKILMKLIKQKEISMTDIAEHYNLYETRTQVRGEIKLELGIV